MIFAVSMYESWNDTVNRYINCSLFFVIFIWGSWFLKAFNFYCKGHVVARIHVDQAIWCENGPRV